MIIRHDVTAETYDPIPFSTADYRRLKKAIKDGVGKLLTLDLGHTRIVDPWDDAGRSRLARNRCPRDGIYEPPSKGDMGDDGSLGRGDLRPISRAKELELSRQVRRRG